MWTIAEYESTSLFTLKPATATSSGGKTLLVPTPYSIKMALLDVACRLEGVAAGEAAWTWLGNIGVALKPSQAVVVNHTFMKVRNSYEFKGKAVDKLAAIEKAKAARKYPFGESIQYREYAYLHGPFELALRAETEAQCASIARWLLNINYLGRRGGFVQLVTPPRRADDLPNDFIRLDAPAESFSLGGSLLTQLDDVGDGLTFTRANIYTTDKITLGKHRVLRHITLPYRRVASSRRYTYYERSDG
jgi:hypothetical protein